MKQRSLLLIALLLAVPINVMAQLAEWPFPQDIPESKPVSIGLAGQKPADIVRYLMAEGALVAKISPDGNQVAFSRRITGQPQLWVVDLRKGWPRQITFGSGISSFHWAPDGEWLLVARDTDGDEREGYFLLSLDGTEERQLLPTSDAFRQFGMFSPDGKQILYSSTERNGRDFDIYTAEVDSGQSRLVYQGNFGFFPAAWQPGGKTVVVTEVRGEDANDVHLLDIETGNIRPLFKPEVAAAYKDFSWLPDGSGFYLATNEGREYSALAFYSMSQQSLQIVEEPEQDVEGVRLSSDGRYLSWATNSGGYSKLHLLDRQSNKRIALPALPEGVYDTRFAHNAPALMMRISGPKTPGDVYVLNLKANRLVQAVESSLAGLDPTEFVVPESHIFPARDGVQLHGLMYLPQHPRHMLNPPVLVMVHGGPTSQARPTFEPIIQHLVNNGIAVFDVNVRGSTGFGKTFTRLDNREKRLDSVRDLVDTAAYLSREKRVDASRIAVMGRSYGGYMVNAVLGAYPGIYDAGVSSVGVSNWVRALEQASPSLKASDRIEYGDIREPRWQKFYAEISPINTAGQIKVPMLVAHGANDPRDPVAESDSIVRKIRENGGEVRYLRFPDEGHGLRKKKNRVTFSRELVEFLDEYLQAQDGPTREVAELETAD